MSAVAALLNPGAALIASPNGVLRARVARGLRESGRSVQQVAGGADALARLEQGDCQLLFLDRQLPDLDSDELRATIEKRFPGTHVVLLDSEEESEKNFSSAIGDAYPGRRHEARASQSMAPLPGMIGSSVAMQRVYRMVRLVASRSTTVLIAGATGTGKELVARALHGLGGRAHKPFVVVNCAAIPDALLESELFGYRRGAFTGAVQSQLGRIARAAGGTLFLDEVSELPLGMQAKLLRFLEQKEVQPLGTCEVNHVDVRVLAASNVELAERVARGEFRQDLFYRLSAFPIELPSLAERKEDIVPLAEHFLASMAAALDSEAPQLDSRAVALLEAHRWPGNVRELQHVMERASILVENGRTIMEEHLYFPLVRARSSGPPAVASLERSYAMARPLA